MSRQCIQCHTTREDSDFMGRYCVRCDKIHGDATVEILMEIEK